jgi:estrone sulfotransferase
MIFRAAKSPCVQKKLMPPIRIRPDDVFIVSYPKSGNTWVRFLLANMLAPGEAITFRNIDDYVPDIYKCADALQHRRGRRYIKSHHPNYELYPKLIYIYRDGRDALVSYYHYASDKEKFTGTFAAFMFSPFASRFSSWREHVEGACEFASKFPERILMLQYEEMLKTPNVGAASISTFLGLGCDDKTIARAVGASSFDRLKDMERQVGGERLGRPGRFFRHGGSGQWREYFSAELYKRYRYENGATLVRLGYEL